MKEKEVKKGEYQDKSAENIQNSQNPQFKRTEDRLKPWETTTSISFVFSLKQKCLLKACFTHTSSLFMFVAAEIVNSSTQIMLYETFKTQLQLAFVRKWPTFALVCKLSIL